MPSGPHIFAHAHNTIVSDSTINAAGRDVNITYINQTDLDEKEILATLKPTKGGHAHGQCMDGTRRDILHEIDNWLDDFSATNTLLLSGSPGAGKSTIAATVVCNLDRLKRLGSSFVFQHSDTSLSDPGAVWRTVASDLARFNSALKDSLVEILKGVDPGGTDINLQFRRLIETPLVQNQDELLRNPPVIVLDALDECDSDRSRSDQRKKLLDTLTLWPNLPRLFKLIVTSRDERLPPSFRRVCKDIVLQTGSRVSLEAENDTRLFLRTRFASISDMYPSLSKWPGEPMIERLTKRAAGLFIWADTLIRFVDNETCSPEEQLDLVLRGDIGGEEDTIRGLYERILDISVKNLKVNTLDAFYLILGTVIFAKVPLRREDLVYFLSEPVKESVIDLILNKLSSVISIGKTDRLIHICHLSFAEFLCDPTRSPKYIIDRAFHSGNLASASFRLMKAGLKFNICNLETSHLRNVDVHDLSGRIQNSIPARLSYACRFSAEHLRHTPSDGHIRDKLLKDIKDFLHYRFLYWLEVMSLMKEVPTAWAALYHMIRWIGNSDTDVVAFAADAAKFVVNFVTLIATSVPHIYLSALPWSPRKSIAAQHFLPKFPNTLFIITGQENYWPATINILLGHKGAVNSVAFSPDGKLIVSGSDDETIRIWDTATGEMIGDPLEGHTGGVNTVGFSPDGKRVVSGSYDDTIRIWDPDTGEMTASLFEGHTYDISVVGFSPDGMCAVSSSYGGIIHIWDTETGEMIVGPFKGHTKWVTSVGFSPDEKYIVSGSDDETIHIWNMETGEEIVGPLKGHANSVGAVRFSPDGKHVISGSCDNTIRIWDAEMGEMVAGPFRGHTDWVNSVGFSPDGMRVVSGSEDKTICIWDAKLGELVAGPFQGHTGSVCCVEFSPDGKHVVSASDDRTVRIWDSEMCLTVSAPFHAHTSYVNSVAFSPDGKHVVSGSDDTTIRIWDAMTGETVAGPFEGHTESVSSVGFSPNGICVVSGSYDKTIRVWDAATGEIVAGPFAGHTNGVTSVAFSLDGKLLVSGSYDRTICIWDAKTSEMVAGPFAGHMDVVTSVAFSPDKKHVVSGSYDKTIRVWDAEMMVAGPFTGHTRGVTSVGFSPNGKHIVSGSNDGTICIWSTETGEMIAGPFKGHTSWINCVGFSPDGKRVVSGSYDQTIGIWDTETGEIIAGLFVGSTASVNSVGFSPDGKCIVSGLDDKTIRICGAETDADSFESRTESVHSIVSSSDGRENVLHSHNRCKDNWFTTHLGKYNHCYLDSASGWVKTDDGRGLLFWVPVNHRGRVCGTDTMTIMGGPMTRVDLSAFVHGHHWVECRR